VKLLRFNSIIFSIFLLSTVVFTQTPTPTPPVSNGDDDDVVKITTTLIQVDVTVTDKNGKIIKDLKPEDFEIYENQTKQPITNFSFIESANATKSTVAPENTASKPNPSKGTISILIPPARLKAENIRRTLAFVVDDLTLDSDSVYFTRKALKKFVDEKMLDGDLIAIIRTSAGIGALQQFTSDKRLLYAAIEGIKWKPNPTNFGGGTFAPMQNSGEQTTQVEAEEKKIEAEKSEYQQTVFASGTLGAVSYVVNGMKELPGRKSIMLISDRLNLTLRTTDSTGNIGSVVPNSEIVKALNRLVETANRAAVVIYTMTANGLPYEGFGAEESSRPSSSMSDVSASELPIQMQNGGGDPSTSPLQDSITAKNTAQLNRIEARQGLVKLAKDTGGLAIINQKELFDNIQLMVDDQKGYYLLGYQPDEKTFDPKTARFNRLFVKANRPDVIVRYRSGYRAAAKRSVEFTFCEKRC
jgi:VWFA-related protein